MTTSQNLESYVPVYDDIPPKWEDARGIIVEQLRKITNAVNIREIGWFLDQELLSGQAFIPGTDPQQYRSVLRIVINFGALPNSSTKSVPHNVIVDANFTLTNMYLAATDPVGFVGFSLQYYSISAGDIKLSYDATNVVVTTSSDYSAYTKSYVVFEYLQEL